MEKTMYKYITFAVLSLIATSARGGDLAAMHAESVDLGSFRGVVYYTAEKDGYRVVATLTSEAEGQPIRFVSTLEPGQRMLISVPQAVGQPSVDFEITRNGEALLIGKSALAPKTGPTEGAPIEEVVHK
jgi:hypothetical protein